MQQEDCVSDYKETILDCYEDNKHRLPGAPANPGVKVVSEGTIEVTWDSPLNNPDAFDLIKVEYRDMTEVGANS